jgi:integrase
MQNRASEHVKLPNANRVKPQLVSIGHEPVKLWPRVLGARNPRVNALACGIKSAPLDIFPKFAYLFPSKTGEFPRWRDNVVKYGLKPILKELGIPAENTGLHAFRHGLATELAERAVRVTVLQKQLRHADVHTTLRVYAHAIPQSQWDAVESIGVESIGTNVPLGTATAA